jgi:inner membrane protein
MENVCHSLFGAVLAKAGLDRLSPLATPASIVAANFPDVDVVTLFGSDIWYLEHHRGITHSVAGILLQAPLVAGLFLLFDRLVRRRRDPSADPVRFGGLCLVALVGLISHLLLDWTNSYGVRPWLPFDDGWHYGDIVFVVDPWLWLALGGALFVASSRRVGVTVMWGAMFAVMALAVGAVGVAGMRSGIGIVPAVVWFVILGAIVAARWLVRTPPVRRIAIGSLATVGAYWLLMSGLHAVALGHAVERAPRPPEDHLEEVAAVPTPMRPDRWRALLATGSRVELADVYLGAADPYQPRESVARNLDDPAVQAALGTCPGQVAFAFNRFLYAEVDPKPDGGKVVYLKDARFGDLAGRSGFSTTPVELQPDLVQAPDDRVCPKLD